MIALPARHLSSLLLALLALGWASGPAQADSPLRVAAHDGVAVAGFDPVAFFIDGKAQPGEASIALRWRGVRWHFATPAHRAAFEANPNAYAPQFGGFCALSVARGRPVPGDPRHWVIVDGRLYLAEGPRELDQFLGSAPDFLQAAQANWARRRAGGN